MNALSAINNAIAHSGKSKLQVARDMGKSDYYVTALVGRGSVPKLDTAAELAHACGYTLYLEGHGERIEIDGRDTNEATEIDGNGGN